MDVVVVIVVVVVVVVVVVAIFHSNKGKTVIKTKQKLTNFPGDQKNRRSFPNLGCH